ncbi:unnamed protein product [Ilex paraguariensis]|uniref:DDT domain-containing protein PTM n=1 Tax=Ilex paraguariensis TaxID=185542 RepID=A0ABC8UTF3_9AQUA
MEFVGRTVKKKFIGFGIFSGTVKSYDSSTGFFQVVYEDGDSEELELSEINPLLDGEVVDQSGMFDLSIKCNKRRRVGDPGNNSENLASKIGPNGEIKRENELGRNETVLANGNLNGNDGVDLNHGLNLNEVLNLNDGLLDLNDVVILNDGFDLNLNEELNLNDVAKEKYGLNLNDEVNVNDGVNLDVKRSEFIDLNLDVIEDSNGSLIEGDSVGGTQKKEHCFDLNLDAECEGQLKENNFYRMDESQILGYNANGAFEGVYVEDVKETSVKIFSGLIENVLGDGSQKEAGSLKRDALDASYVIDGGSSETPLKGLSDAGAAASDGYPVNLGSFSKGRRGRKRRMLVDSVNSSTETVLRRSTRRGRATFSAEDHVSSAVISNVIEDPSSSPVVSPVSDEKPAVSGRGESEGCSVLPPKPQLPPSSENLNMEDIPILDLFSVYSFLRSFSTSLFLSPFTLEDFVAAVNCKDPNSLFDYIHISLLQTLRKHLDSLSDESSQSASSCLRGLNWDLLDLITWPIFMIEYLLHGSELNPGFDLCRLKLSGNDYYKQPAAIKIEMLRRLSDDVIEVDAIRSELNRRTLTTEPNIDVDRNTKFETSRKSRAVMGGSGDSCLAEGEVDETKDGNSDECCLCKMDGSLLCCDGCPAAFHSRCIGVASSLLPDGDWYCPECVIDRDRPWMKIGMSIRGAELLGIDPYGRLYFSSCGYLLVCAVEVLICHQMEQCKPSNMTTGCFPSGILLLKVTSAGSEIELINTAKFGDSSLPLLVSDSCDTGYSFHYYHTNDVPVVIEALQPSNVLYSTILSAIFKHWDVSNTNNGAKRGLDSRNVTICSDFLVKGQMPANPMPSRLLEASEFCMKDEIVNTGKPEEKSLISVHPSNGGCEVSELIHFNPVNVNHSMTMESLLASSQGSADISQAISGMKNIQKDGLECLDNSAGMSNDSEIPGKPVCVGDSPLASSNLEVEQGKSIQSATQGGTSSTITTRGNMSQGQSGASYVNYYVFARTASSVAEEFTRKSSGKISKETARSIEDIISGQLKTISDIPTEFCWPNINKINADARKEKCGWCFSCRFPDEQRECLFVMNDSGPVVESFTSEVLGIRSRKNWKGHLIDVMCHILCIEDRLQGLLLGPWLNPHYSKLWRKSVLKASGIASMKHLLLTVSMFHFLLLLT